MENSWAREKYRWTGHQNSFFLGSPIVTTLPLVAWNRQFTQVGGDFPIQDRQKSTTFYHRRITKDMGSTCIPKQAGLLHTLENCSFLTWPLHCPAYQLFLSQGFSTSLTVAVPLRTISWSREWTKEIVSTAQWLMSTMLVLKLQSILQYSITKKIETTPKGGVKTFSPVYLLLQWPCPSDEIRNHKIYVSGIN